MSKTLATESTEYTEIGKTKFIFLNLFSVSSVAK